MSDVAHVSSPPFSSQVKQPFPFMTASEFIPMWVKKPSKAQEADEQAKDGKRPDTPTFFAAMDAMALAYHAAGVWPSVLVCML